MKKILFLLLTLCLCLSVFSGCQKEDAKNETVSSDNQGKTFNELGLQFQYPAHWDTLKRQVDDVTVYFFRDPDLGGNYYFTVFVTNAGYQHEYTQEEYLEDLSKEKQDVKITSYKNDFLAGYKATKITATYTEKDIDFVYVAYDNVVVGQRLYHFEYCYPKTQETKYYNILESICNSMTIE